MVLTISSLHSHAFLHIIVFCFLFCEGGWRDTGQLEAEIIKGHKCRFGSFCCTVDLSSIKFLRCKQKNRILNDVAKKKKKKEFGYLQNC